MKIDWDKFTPFRKKVYKAVLKIPLGQVKSYKWVAAKIGNPKAVRAVGQALKKNPHTVKIPCHRVISSDGSIGGYSKGIESKKKILRDEKLKTTPQKSKVLTFNLQL